MRSEASLTLPGRKEPSVITVNQAACLLIEEGPLYDILRVNVSQCKSVRIDGLDLTSSQEGGLGELAPVGILHSKLAEIANQPILVIPKRKIPAKILTEVRTVLQLIYEKHHTEGAVLVVYDTTTGEFETVVPKQTDTSVTCTIEAEDSQCWLSATKRLAANFHSHPFGGRSAFLSSTDDVQAFAIPGAPIASFNFNPAPRVGNLYNFGTLKCEFGEIDRLEAEDFCELPEEIFEISQEDRDKWQPLIDERVSAPGFSYSRSGWSQYNHLGNGNAANPQNGSTRPGWKTRQGKSQPASQETLEGMDYQAMTDDEQLAYWEDCARRSERGVKIALPSCGDEDDDDDCRSGSEEWEAEALCDAAEPDNLVSEPWIELLNGVSDYESFDLYETMCATNAAIEKIRKEYHPDMEHVSLAQWDDEAINFLYQVTLGKDDLTSSDVERIQKIFPPMNKKAFNEDIVWTTFLAGLFAIGYAQVDPNAFEVLLILSHRCWKGSDFPLDKCPDPRLFGSDSVNPAVKLTDPVDDTPPEDEGVKLEVQDD